MSSSLPIPTTPVRSSRRDQSTPMRYRDDNTHTSEFSKRFSGGSHGSSSTIPSSFSSTSINNNTQSTNNSNSNSNNLQSNPTQSQYQYNSSESTVAQEIPERHHRRESSLLAHLELDEQETQAWKSIASPKTPHDQHHRRVVQHTQSVPAYCFPSLRGKIPPTTPVRASPVPSLDVGEIQQLERPQVRRERSEMRYSVYVKDGDFDVPTRIMNKPPNTGGPGWMRKLRHGHSNSISDMFGLVKIKEKDHKASKSVSSEVTQW